jgi:hypothetical protein
LKISVTLNTECKPFRLVAKCLNKLHYPSAPPDVLVHIEIRKLELLGNMGIMDETKMAEKNCELEQEAEYCLNRWM